MLLNSYFLSLCLQADLSRKFKVSGIPTLVFVNAENGQLITADGRAIVMEDTEGKDFPWAPKPFQDIIAGKFINKDKAESSWDDVKGKVLGVYFSAHWVCVTRFCCVSRILMDTSVTGGILLLLWLHCLIRSGSD